MHKALYRDNLTLEQARERIAGLTAMTCRGGRRCGPDAGFPGWPVHRAGNRALTQGARACDVALVAGEASGDLLAAQLLVGMRQRWPGWRAAGIGGPQMQAQGFDAWWPSDKLAVRGYVEVLRHYREIVGIRRQLRDRLLAAPPRLFVGVDAPDFNLDLEGDLRAAGVKTVHFVAPAVWAWRAERIEKIRRNVDHLLCIFPFEAALFHKHGIAATYVGHPLAPLIPMAPDRQAARLKLGLSDEQTVVALLPGSRRSEIEHLLPRFLQAAQQMLLARPGLAFVLPAVPALQSVIQQGVERAGLQASVRVTRGGSHDALAACDVTLDCQWHRHAGSGAVQAPHGHRVPHEQVVVDAAPAQTLAALGGAAQHPGR
jgi:lipid-A-disaccharide synthase